MDLIHQYQITGTAKKICAVVSWNGKDHRVTVKAPNNYRSINRNDLVFRFQRIASELIQLNIYVKEPTAASFPDGGFSNTD